MFKSQLDISKNACRSLFPPKRTFKIKLDSKIDGVLMLQVKKKVLWKNLIMPRLNWISQNTDLVKTLFKIN